MGISVIIAHFAPPGSGEIFRDILKLTIASVRNQLIEFDLELVLCDDGSGWSTKEFAEIEPVGDLVDLVAGNVKKFSCLRDLNIDRYLYINSGNNYWAIRLKDLAIRTAKHEKIVILDDDHLAKLLVYFEEQAIFDEVDVEAIYAASRRKPSPQKQRSGGRRP